MKYRWIWLLPAAYFPYHVLIAMRLLRSGRLGVLYENAAPPVVFSSLGVWICGFLGAIVWAVLSYRADDPAASSAKTVRNVKLAQIPAFLVFFQACFIFPFTIMTVPISVFYIPICLLAILLTGLAGAVAADICRRCGATGRGKAVLYGFLMFVFAADLAAAWFLHEKARKIEK